jgi:subtilisin
MKVHLTLPVGMRRRTVVVFLSALVGGLAVAAGAGARNGGPPSGDAKGGTPSLGVQDRGSNDNDEAGPNLKAPGTDPETLQRLRSKAAAEGVVPVIVGLNVDARPEGLLTEGERGRQRAEVAQIRARLLRELGQRRVDNVKEADEVPYVAMHVSPEALRALEQSPLVAGIDEDHEVEADLGSPSGTSSNESLVDWWNWNAIDVYRSSWDNNYKGDGQTVVIADTGVKRSHSWLSGKVVSEACYSTTTPGSIYGGCPNGRSAQTGTGSAAPCTYHVVLCSHGTHVAGTAAGINGVAADAKIVAMQVFHRHPTTGEPTYYESDVLSALKRTYDLRTSYSIAAINLSLGGGFDINGATGYCDSSSTTLKSVYSWVQTLRSVKIATVVSSGNDGWSNGTRTPACLSNVISVGNSTVDLSGYEAAYSGSNSAWFVSLVAPGTHICSSVTYQTEDCTWTGTSMAAPHVTGAIAALKQLRSTASVTSMASALRSAGPSIYDSRNGYSFRRLDVWGALIALYNS